MTIPARDHYGHRRARAYQLAEKLQGETRRNGWTVAAEAILGRYISALTGGAGIPPRDQAQAVAWMREAGRDGYFNRSWRRWYAGRVLERAGLLYDAQQASAVGEWLGNATLPPSLP